MNQSLLIFLIVLILAYYNKYSAKEDTNIIDSFSGVNSITIDTLEILNSELTLNQIEGKWYYNNEPFNGFSIKCHSNGTVAERFGFYNGKREGVARQWSKNGVLRVESGYYQNRLVGKYRSWWENGVLSAESNYVNGLKQGVEKKWYHTGQLAKLCNIVDGKEHGMQKAWLQNGKLYVNYEAKNGRIFGMKRANSCYKLEDEVIVRHKNR